MDSFHIALPSNASFDVYPDNKKSNNTTQFNSPLIKSKISKDHSAPI